MPATVDEKKKISIAASRASAMKPGATWPVDREGKQKKIVDFSAAEKKTVLCMFERRVKGSCSKGAECEFCHVIPEGRTKGEKGSGKKGRHAQAKGAAKTAGAAAAAASAVTGGPGRETEHASWEP
jgi:hypothetical protein